MKTRKLLAFLTAVLMMFSLFAIAASAVYDDGGISVMSLLPLESYDEYVTIDRTLSMPYALVGEPRYTVYVRELLNDALQKYGITEAPAYVAYSTSSSFSSYRRIGWNDTITFGSSSSDLYFITGDDQFDPNNKRITVHATINDYYSDEYRLDLTVNTPENFTPGVYPALTYGDILTPTLVKYGIIPEGGVYTGKVQREFYERDDVSGKYVYVWRDVSLTDNFAYSNSASLEFTLDDGLGTDQSFKRVSLSFYYNDPYMEFIYNLNCNVKNADGKLVYKSARGNAGLTHDEDTQQVYYVVSLPVSAYEFENNAVPYINLRYLYPDESEVKVYSGLHYDVSELTPELDITEAISGEGQMALEPQQDSTPIVRWGISVTYAVTLANGSSFSVPCKINVNLYENDVYFSTYGGTRMSLYSSTDLENSVYNYLGNYYCTWATDIKGLGISLRGYYYNYVMNENGQIIDGISNVVAAYQGHYDIMPPETEAQNIRDTLFHVNYNYYNPDFSKAKEIMTAYYPAYDSERNIVWEDWKIVSIEFSVFDIYGKVHHPEFMCAYKIYDTMPDMYIPSNSTGFGVYYLNSDSNGYDYYNLKDISGYDSYYSNGFRTYLVGDKEGTLTDGTVVYPCFYTYDDNTTVYLGSDPQKSGESPVTFESEKIWNYSAASESHEKAENYFVTFITPHRGGSKLFVNGANCEDTYNKDGKPTREILFNYSNYSYNINDEHDIIIANVGDVPLTGIDVKLSEDTRGVKLDPYWSVTENSLATLAPFDGISFDRYYKGVDIEGVLQNVAMIKLVPEDKTYAYEKVIDYDSEGNPIYSKIEIPGFADISGTLTVSADGNEPVEIELTGLTGIPKIITTEIRDGVKYVPYSNLIQTNCMYGNDNMQFTLLPGSDLPDGIELMPNGELYGIPREAGEFTICVEAKYTGKIPNGYSEEMYASRQIYTFTIEDNTDENVDAVNVDEQGYELTNRISKYVTVYYNGVDSKNLPIIDKIEIDSDLFRSEGSYTGEFKAFYIDSIKLTEGVDYTAEDGSTIITVLAETFGHIGLSDTDTPHTLAAEFRNDVSELKRSAQNVYMKYILQSDNNLTPPSGPSLPSNPGTGLPSVPGGIGTLPPTNAQNGSNTANNGTDVENIDDSFFETVGIIFNMVDASGNPAVGLPLELHSDVQNGITDETGAVRFGSVEFGRHVLSVKGKDGNTTVSKSFTLVSGFDSDVSGDNIITAEVGHTVVVNVEFDGSNLKLISAETYIEAPQEGTTAEEDPREFDADEDNPITGIALCIMPSMLAAVAYVIFKKK